MINRSIVEIYLDPDSSHLERILGVELHRGRITRSDLQGQPSFPSTPFLIERTRYGR